MKTIPELIYAIESEATAARFAEIYGADAVGVKAQQERYIKAVGRFCEEFDARDDMAIFSAPGRTEIGGNHTDHQHGRVLAAGVNLDVIAITHKRDDAMITVISEGFTPDYVDSTDMSIHPEETGHSPALVRGVCSGFLRRGYKVGGFDAYTISSVLKGSGLSSSAAFEVLVGTILNHLYNDGKIDPVTIAQIAQYAEREYFGKPCGLMDQTASAVGSFVAIDFEDPTKPVVEKVAFNFADCGHDLVIVDTKGNHSDLTDDYAAIGAEMRSVAACFGKEVLREVDKDAFYANMGQLKGKVSDRALLRAIHFFDDNDRAAREADLLRAGDFDAFKQEILASGRSSAMHLQNAYSIQTPDEQGIPLTLALTARMLEGKGAWRVHGGGFAGTIQAFVPCELTPAYRDMVEAVLGAGSCHVLQIRPVGAVRIL
ncbi:MAG: galactokinase [Clostridia bacterium]|nr:galactokinase [Clostridia bacterium]